MWRALDILLTCVPLIEWFVSAMENRVSPIFISVLYSDTVWESVDVQGREPNGKDFPVTSLMVLGQQRYVDNY